MLEQFPAYKASLHQRYPPVCRECQAAVDEELRKKDYMARTSALGSRLKESKRAKHAHIVQSARTRDVLIWKLRGCLWIVSQACAVWMFTLGLLNGIDSVYVPSPHTTLAFILLSLFWMFWDPTWHTVRRSTLAGQRVRVLGRSQYIKCQFVVWISRLLSCGLGVAKVHGYVYVRYARSLCAIAIAIEVTGLVLSALSLRIQRPLPVRLIDTRRPQKKIETSQLPSEPDPGPLLSALTLAPEPVLPSISEPVFGQTSTPKAHASLVPTVDDDEMDWTPTGPGADDSNWDQGWFKPQRFFAPEQPTGLEGLLKRTTLRDLDAVQATPRPPRSAVNRPWMYLTVLIVLIAIAWATTMRNNTVRTGSSASLGTAGAAHENEMYLSTY